jgi:hypothetical protein
MSPFWRLEFCDGVPGILEKKKLVHPLCMDNTQR